jgi:hypothetical protein
MPTRSTLNGGVNELNDACTNCFYLGGRAPVAAGNGSRANQCSIANTRKPSKPILVFIANLALPWTKLYPQMLGQVPSVKMMLESGLRIIGFQRLIKLPRPTQ